MPPGASFHKERYNQVCQKQLNSYAWRRQSRSPDSSKRGQKTLTKANTEKCRRMGIIRKVYGWMVLFGYISGIDRKDKKARNKLKKGKEWQGITGQVKKNKKIKMEQ